MRRAVVIGAALGITAILVASVALVAVHPSFTRLEPGPRQVPLETAFYVDPDSAAAEWLRHNPDDSRVSPIRDRIASQPQARWFAQYNPGDIEEKVRRFVTPALRRGEVPVLVPYLIPHRDCGGPSAGGAPDVDAYQRWIDGFAKGLGSARAWIILEPDALGQAECLNGQQREERMRALADAARTLRDSSPDVRIYYDSGHSAWHSVSTMVKRLKQAGADEHAHGIALNVSNFSRTESEVRYGEAILQALRDPDLRMVVDTSRNGNGPAPGRPVCDPPQRKLGTNPTVDTGNPWVDAFLWVKSPGESDGCLAADGTFVPASAYELVRSE